MHGLEKKSGIWWLKRVHWVLIVPCQVPVQTVLMSLWNTSFSAVSGHQRMFICCIYTEHPTVSTPGVSVVRQATYDWLTKISLNPDFWHCWFLITQSLLYSSWFVTFFCLKISQNVTFVHYLNSCMLRSLWQMWDSWFIRVGKKAENVQEDVRCFILLSRIVQGGKMSVISSGPGNNPHRRSISTFVFAWEDKNLPVMQ